MRTVSEDLADIVFGERGDVGLSQFLKQKLVTEPPRGFASALFLAAKDGEIDACVFQQFNHGAGDTLAAAIASALAHGYTVPDAVAFGKRWVTECLRAAYPLGQGHGPVSALFRLNE